MNKEQLLALEELITAKIDAAIESAFGRDCLLEANEVYRAREELYKLFGLTY